MFKVFFLLIIFIALLFLSIYLTRPLSQGQIQSLAKKRRANKIKAYFNFTSLQFAMDTILKKAMQADGSFINVNFPVKDFPSIAAAMLKYKKHEWVIIAFEKNQLINLVWANKGHDRSSVDLFLTPDQIIKTASKHNSSSILIFHNHPNSNPKYYDCSKPSIEDIRSAEAYAFALSSNELNLIEFVCERGNHHQYFKVVSDQFFPVQNFTRTLNKSNNKSKLSNVVLHLERFF